MALLFCEGFEGYGTTAGTNFDGDFFSNKWITENAGNTQIGSGHDGGQSLRVHSASLAARFEPQGATVLDDEFTLGFRFRYTALANVCILAAFRLNTSVRTNLLLNLDGTISVRRSTTVLATGATALVSGQWYYLELKTKCRDVGSYELRIDGVTELSDASEDMNPGGADGFNNLRFTANTGTTIEFDDLYLLDSTGSANNTFLGDSKVRLLFPDGAGDQTQWTPDSGSNFARVNEAAPDGNTSYVETSTGSNEDLYNFGTLPGGTVYGVQVDIHAINASASLALLAKSGSTTGAGSTHSLTASYAAYRSIFEENPDTSSPWTQSEVLAAQFGLRRVSGTPRVTRIAAAVLQMSDDPFEVDGESTLVLTDEAEFEADAINVDAESTLALDDDLVVDVDSVAAALSTLALAQVLDLNIVVAPAGVSTLALVSQGSANRETDAEALTSLVLNGDVAIGIESKPVEHDLTMTDLASAFTTKNAVSELLLTDEAFIPWAGVSTLFLTDEAVFVPPAGARLLTSELVLTQSAVTQKTLNLLLVSSLSLGQGLAVITPREECDWDDIDQPAGVLTKGIKLIGDSTIEISRSMNLGDIDRLAFDRIIRETRGGTLHVFADPIWPKTETLVFTLSAVKRTKAQEVLDFMLVHLGRDITLETHEGRQWLGFVLNPGEAVIEDHPNSFTISIEFEGELVPA